MEREINAKIQQKTEKPSGNGQTSAGPVQTAELRRSATLATRELNPALFGGTSSRRPTVIDGSQQLDMPHVMQSDQKINDFGLQLGSMAEHVGKLTQQFTEWTKSSHSKFERLQSQIAKLEQNDHYIVTEAAQKFSQVNTRFGERKSLDIKIQEMIDRHNSVLKSFEMRLTQMQRLLAEKESQLLATTAALNESKMEIARLKRM
jgi:hypothetical protein